MVCDTTLQFLHRTVSSGKFFAERLDKVTYPTVAEFYTECVPLIMLANLARILWQFNSQIRLCDIQYCIPRVEALVHECADVLRDTQLAKDYFEVIHMAGSAVLAFRSFKNSPLIQRSVVDSLSESWPLQEVPTSNSLLLGLLGFNDVVLPRAFTDPKSVPRSV
jgi:hypothetical protein